MKLLNLPVPVLAALAIPQIEGPPVLDGPAWVSVFIAGAFVVLWLLNAIGKLPGARGERRTTGFGDEDRAKLSEAHKVVTREDGQKPGWMMVWHSSEESRELRAAITRLATLAETWQEDREDWKRERSTMQAQIARLEESLRVGSHARGTGTEGAP